jgi:long-chain fatty acid transport protein
MSRRFRALLTGTLLVAGLSGIVHAAGFAIAEQSGRAMGTAGAFVAGQSPASIFFNPAGITAVGGTELEVGLNVILPSTEFTGPTDRPEFGTESMVSHVFFPPNAYAVWQAGERTTLGLGLFSYMGLGTEWEENWIGRTVTESIFLESVTLNPTIAWSIGDNTSFGLGLDLLYAMATMSKDSYTGFPFNGYVDVELEGDGLAWGWNLGLQHQVTPELRLGLSFRSGMTLKVDGEAEFAFENIDNPSQLALLGALFPATEAKLEVEIPSLTMFGWSWTPGAWFDGKLTWRGDFVYTNWDVYTNLFIDFETETEALEDSNSPKLYDNTWAFRTGVEYALDDVWTLRAGGYYEQNAVLDEWVEPSLPDAERNGFSLGCSYEFDRGWGLDAYYLHVLLQDRVSTFAELPGGYESQLPIFGLSLRKSF